MGAEKTIDLSLADLVNFLDEERRKDKALLLELEQRLENQAAQLSELASREAGLEDQMRRLQAELAALPSIEDTLERVKGEINQILEKYREERRRSEAESLALRQREMQEQAQALQALREEIKEQVEKMLAPQISEVERLAGILVEFHQGTEALLEREREHHRRIDYLEGWAAQSAKKIGELELGLQEREKSTSQFLEKLRAEEEERRKETQKLPQAIESIRQAISSSKQEQEVWRKNRQDAEKTLAELQKLEKDLITRENEYGELLKLEGNRMRMEWKEWSKEMEKSLEKSRAAIERQTTRENKRQKELLSLWQTQLEHFRQQLAQSEAWLKDLEERLRLLG
ncbi:MAG: hypothetical protein HYX86_02485 [Chloroflexi bacterium]|nr:hypothetical protein [Chloroflexota bacterium]